MVFMFRRTGKNVEKENLFYEDSPIAAPYKQTKKNDSLSTFEPSSELKKNEEEKPVSLAHHFQGLIKEEPETTLGEGVIFRGELTFERLLKIDGTFEGELISQGKIIVGPKGKVKANLNLKEAIIEGKVEGNITVQERVELRGEAIVIGDIEAKLLSVDEGVSINGNVRVNPSLT